MCHATWRGLDGILTEYVTCVITLTILDNQMKKYQNDY
jgi:hypothetical protein